MRCELIVLQECKLSTSVADPNPEDPYVFGPPESVTGSVSQRYGSEDPHPDPYQNVRDPQHCFIHIFSI